MKHGIGSIVAAMSRHLVAVGAGIATLAMLGRMLSHEALGAWALLGTSGALFGLADLGLSTVVQRATVRVRDEAEGESTTPAVAESLTLALGTTLVTAPLLMLGAARWLFSTPTLAGMAGQHVVAAMRVVLAAGLFAAVAQPLRAFCMARGRIQPLALARAAAAAAQVTVTASGLVLRLGLLAPALGLAAGTVLEALVLVVVARRAGARLHRPERVIRAWASAVGEGASSLLVNAAVVFAVRADVLVLARYSPLAAVAAYNVAARATDQLFTLLKQVSAALLPSLGSHDGRERSIRQATALLGGTAASSLTALAMVGHPVLRAWVGSVVDHPVTGPVLALLAVAATLSAVVEMPTLAVTLGAKSAWTGAVPQVAGCVLNAVITFGGARAFGLWAVAGGTVIGNFVIAVWLWAAAARLQRWTFAETVGAVVPVVAAAGVALPCGWVLSRAAGGALVPSIAAGAVTTAAGCLAAWVSSRRANARADRSARVSLVHAGVR